MKTQTDLEYMASVKRVLDIITDDIARAKEIKDLEVREIAVKRLEQQRIVLIDILTEEEAKKI